MNGVMSRTMAFLRSEEGPTTTEYSVMLALIIVMCLVGIGAIGTKVDGIFTSMGDQIPTGDGS